MSARSFNLSPDIQAYVLDHTTAPSAVEASLIAETQALGRVSGMQISREQGVLLRTMVHMLQPQLVIEVGTFTGYSALMMAQALPDGARILCCDVSEEWTSIGRRHWEEAGVADRIDLRIAPGIDTLQSLAPDSTVDLAFIDADKGGYRSYIDELLPRLSSRGVIAVDNTLWSGRVVDDAANDDDTVALRALNDWLVSQSNLDITIVPIGDGLTLIRHR
jgi:caffeoyl-CoA O-methyltransferase